MIKLQTVNDQIEFYQQASKVDISDEVNHNKVWQVMRELLPHYTTDNMLLFVAHDKILEFIENLPTHDITEYNNLYIDEFGRFGKILNVNCITDKGCLVKYIDGVKLAYTNEEIYNW